MKPPYFYTSRFPFQFARPRRRQSGSAVIVVMALLAILLVYVAGNIRTLSNLGRELRLLERQQTRRLQAAAQRTNSPPAVISSTNYVPRSAAP